MKVIVAGSRHIQDMGEVKAAIRDSGFPISVVICGGADGVDMLGLVWAVGQGLSVRMVPADWAREGRAAGPLRNARMAEMADALVLVWDGVSKGSRSMLGEALCRGLPVHQRVVG